MRDHVPLLAYMSMAIALEVAVLVMWSSKLELLNLILEEVISNSQVQVIGAL